MLHAFVWFSNHDAYSGLKGTGDFEFTYYSFVTIATLSCGDIQPLSYAARWLSVVADYDERKRSGWRKGYKKRGRALSR